jgi:DNA segregation ATPase FtsK/SpoIIIE, S-DNA-T family
VPTAKAAEAALVGLALDSEAGRGIAVVSRIRDLGAVTLVLSADPREGVIAGDVRGAERPPGRGVLVRRRAANEVVQVLLSDPGNPSE